jgi:hypothetical protein
LVEQHLAAAHALARGYVRDLAGDRARIWPNHRQNAEAGAPEAQLGAISRIE